MSSVSAPDPGANAIDSGGEAPTQTEREVAALRRAAAVGRSVLIVASLALIGQAAAWLVVGVSPIRTALAWGTTAVLGLCVAAVALTRTGSPAGDRETAYRIAWQAGLRGAVDRWWRLVIAGVAVPAFLASCVGMGASSYAEPTDAVRISEAGARIVPVSAVDVRQLGKTGKGRYDDYRALAEVRLPAGKGGSPKSFQVEVVSENALRVGDRIYAAYAPDSAALRPIADDQRFEVEQELSGQALDFRIWIGVLILWAGGTITCVVLLIRGGAGLSPSARVRHTDRGMLGVSAQIARHIRYSPSGTKPSDALNGLELRVGSVGVPFGTPGSSPKHAVSALRGESGRLEWSAELPEELLQNPLKTIPADFVAPDGRRLPGDVPINVLQQLVADGAAQHVPHPPRPAAATAKLTDIGATWPATVRPVALLLAMVAVLAPVPMYLAASATGWGVGLVIVGAVAAGAAVVANSYDSAFAAAENEQGG